MGRLRRCLITLCLFAAVCRPTFAMSGALAWQVKKLNKNLLYWVFEGGRWHGNICFILPGSPPSVCASGRSFLFLLSFPLFLFSLYAGLFTKRTSYATKTNKATTMQQSRMSMNSTTRGILLHPHNNLLQILFMVLTDMATLNNFIFISLSKIVVVHSLNTSSYNLFCFKLAAICTSLFVFILDIYLLL